MIFETIETKLLILRKLTDEVYQYLLNNYTDSEIMEHLGIKTAEELANEKEKIKQSYTSYGKTLLLFQLIDKETDTVIGWCGYHTWYTKHFRAEIGYVLDDPFKNKGLMTEALKRIIEYGFNNMNLNRIEAFVGKDNIPSLKLMENFGFSQEGLLKEHYNNNGVLEDSLLFALLKNNYPFKV